MSAKAPPKEIAATGQALREELLRHVTSRWVDWYAEEKARAAAYDGHSLPQENARQEPAVLTDAEAL